MQSFIDWASMDGYGGYVWSVLVILVVVIGGEVGRLKLAEHRSKYMSEFK